MFYWASAGKTWVAIAVLQLVEEGKLSLSDPLDRWAPDFPNARLISVEQLLNHTSGLFSFQDDEGLRARPGFKSPDEILRVARSHEPLFCPGQAWAYSNTGYVLLGLIVEKVDGRPLHEALTARIVDRLGLRETRILAQDASLDSIAAPVQRTGVVGGTADDIRTPGAAGAIAASAADMVRFWSAALTGELTSKKSARDQFGALYPMFNQAGQYYGRGVMLLDVPASPNTPADLWLGHSGGLPGATAIIVWSTRTRSVLTVALAGDAPAEAIANRLLATLE
jgi:D-alanyl-D-alanine carboxypeptidase